MIVVTGASGHLGRQVVEGLLQHLPASQLGVSVRDVSKAADLQARGVRVRHGDFAHPETLAGAFEGVEQLFLVSVNKFGDEAVQQHRHAIAAAKQAGARRILYTSHQAADPAGIFVPSRDHAATETLLQESGLAFVSLRNGFYAESALFQLGSLKQGQGLSLPADGPVSWTARADLAAAAVAALTQPGLFDGISPPLTGASMLDFAAIAQLASEIQGHPVRREQISDEAYRAGLVAHGLPEAMAAALGTLYQAARAREFAVVDPTLEGVLRRPPVTMREILKGFLQSA